MIVLRTPPARTRALATDEMDASREYVATQHTNQEHWTANTNGRCERFIQSIKHECLLRFILFGQRHLDVIVGQWVRYYNTVRSHTERGYLPPVHQVPEEVPKLDRDEVVVRSYVGGLVKAFERRAA